MTPQLLSGKTAQRLVVVGKHRIENGTSTEKLALKEGDQYQPLHMLKLANQKSFLPGNRRLKISHSGSLRILVKGTAEKHKLLNIMLMLMLVPALTATVNHTKG